MTPNAHLPCHAQRAADVRPPTVRLYAPPTLKPRYRGFDVLFSAGMRRARRPRRRPTARSVHRASLTSRACAPCPGPAIPTCARSHSLEARLRPSALRTLHPPAPTEAYPDRLPLGSGTSMRALERCIADSQRFVIDLRWLATHAQVRIARPALQLQHRKLECRQYAPQTTPVETTFERTAA